MNQQQTRLPANLEAPFMRLFSNTEGRETRVTRAPASNGQVVTRLDTLRFKSNGVPVMKSVVLK